MKIAVITTDNREHHRDYALEVPYFGTAPEALLQGFASIPELEVHVVTCTQKPMKSPEKLAENIWFHSLYVPKIGWMRTSYQGCIRAVRRRLKIIKPDVVHGQGTERECAASAVFSRFPNVLTIHGNMRLVATVNNAPPLSFLGMAALLEKMVLPRTDGVVCITRYTQEAVRELARKTWVLPNAVHASFFELQPAPEVIPIILCVGLVCYRKNQNAFIRALDELAVTNKFKLVFVGAADKSEPYGTEFFDLMASRSWCEHAGFASREILKGWFKRASMLALPSLEDNCPMSVLEAMAAAVPVMAANVGGVPDLVTDGKTGILCHPLDAASMSTGVRTLLNDKLLAQTLASNAKQDASARFHPSVIARGHMEIYKEVLSNRP